MSPTRRRVILLATASAPLAFMLVHQVLVPPVVGIADNGDAFRLFEPFGIVSALAGEQRFFAFLVRDWTLDPALARSTGFLSSDQLLVGLSLLLNPLLAEPGHFDIRAIGVVRALSYLGAMAVVLSALVPLGRTAVVAAAAALALVFCDVGYVAYFNSGYTEASSFVFGMLAAGFFLRLTLAPRAGAVDLAGFTAAAVLLIWSKPQNVVLALPLAIVAFRCCALGDRAQWGRATVAAACIALAGLAWRVIPPPVHYRDAIHYIAVFNAILPASPAPTEDLEALGVPAALASLNGVYPWQPEALARAAELQATFYPVVTDAALARFLATRPAHLRHLLGLAAANALDLRPALGNFEAAAGLPAYARSTRYTMRERLVQSLGPPSLRGLALVAAGVVLVAGLFRARARTPGERLLAEGVVLLLAAAAVQYAAVAALQGHLFGAKGMAVFAFLFDLSMAFGAGMGIALAGRVGRPPTRALTPAPGIGPSSTPGARGDA